MGSRLIGRLSIRQRMVAAIVVLALAIGSLVLLVVVGQGEVALRQIAAVQNAREVNRLLLRAHVHVTSSGSDLWRYTQGLVPHPAEALVQVESARAVLERVRPLMDDPALIRRLDALAPGLLDYRATVEELHRARQAGEMESAAALEAEASRASASLAAQVESMIWESQIRLDEADAQVFARTRGRFLTLLLIGLGASGLALVLALLLGRSVRDRLERLLSWVDAAAETDQPASLPELGGQDEVAAVGRAFGQMLARHAEERQASEAQAEAQMRELRRLLARTQAALGVSRAVGDILDPEALMQSAVDALADRFGLYYVGLFLVDEQEEVAILRAGTGAAGRAMVAREHQIEIGQGMVGWCVAHDQARVSLQAEEDAIRLRNPELPDTRSEAALPLRARGRVIGALTVQDDKPGAFDEALIDLLQMVGDMLAVTLDTAQRLAATQEALDEAQSRYGRLTQEGWSRLLQDVSLGYRASARGRPRRLPPEWEPELLEARQRAEAVLLEDGMSLALPVLARGEVIGVVRMRKPEERAAWSEREIGLMQTVVEQLGIALDSARLYQDSQRREASERLTREVTARMREPLDLQAVLETAANEMRQALNLDELLIRLAVPE